MTTKDLKRDMIDDLRTSIKEADLYSGESTNGKVNPEERRTLTDDEKEAWEKIRRTGDPYNKEED